MIIGILSGIIVLLLGVCIALGLLSMKQNNQVKELEEQVLQLEEQVLQLEEQVKQLMLNDITNVDTLLTTLNDDSVQNNF